MSDKAFKKPLLPTSRTNFLLRMISFLLVPMVIWPSSSIFKIQIISFHFPLIVKALCKELKLVASHTSNFRYLFIKSLFILISPVRSAAACWSNLFLARLLMIKDCIRRATESNDECSSTRNGFMGKNPISWVFFRWKDHKRSCPVYSIVSWVSLIEYILDGDFWCKFFPSNGLHQSGCCFLKV